MGMELKASIQPQVAALVVTRRSGSCQEIVRRSRPGVPRDGRRHLGNSEKRQPEHFNTGNQVSAALRLRVARARATLSSQGRVDPPQSRTRKAVY